MTARNYCTKSGVVNRGDCGDDRSTCGQIGWRHNMAGACVHDRWIAQDGNKPLSVGHRLLTARRTVQCTADVTARGDAVFTKF